MTGFGINPHIALIKSSASLSGSIDLFFIILSNNFSPESFTVPWRSILIFMVTASSPNTISPPISAQRSPARIRRSGASTIE